MCERCGRASELRTGDLCRPDGPGRVRCLSSWIHMRRRHHLTRELPPRLRVRSGDGVARCGSEVPPRQLLGLAPPLAPLAVHAVHGRMVLRRLGAHRTRWPLRRRLPVHGQQHERARGVRRPEPSRVDALHCGQLVRRRVRRCDTLPSADLRRVGRAQRRGKLHALRQRAVLWLGWPARSDGRLRAWVLVCARKRRAEPHGRRRFPRRSQRVCGQRNDRSGRRPLPCSVALRRWLEQPQPVPERHVLALPRPGRCMRDVPAGLLVRPRLLDVQCFGVRARTLLPAGDCLCHAVPVPKRDVLQRERPAERVAVHPVPRRRILCGRGQHQADGPLQRGLRLLWQLVDANPERRHDGRPLRGGRVLPHRCDRRRALRPWPVLYGPPDGPLERRVRRRVLLHGGQLDGDAARRAQRLRGRHRRRVSPGPLLSQRHRHPARLPRRHVQQPDGQRGELELHRVRRGVAVRHDGPAAAGAPLRRGLLLPDRDRDGEGRAGGRIRCWGGGWGGGAREGC